MGPTHLDTVKLTRLNSVGSGLVFLFLIGAFVFIGYKSRKSIVNGIKTWHTRMKIDEEKAQEKEQIDKDKGDEEPRP